MRIAFIEICRRNYTDYISINYGNQRASFSIVVSLQVKDPVSFFGFQVWHITSSYILRINFLWDDVELVTPRALYWIGSDVCCANYSTCIACHTWPILLPDIRPSSAVCVFHYRTCLLPNVFLLHVDSLIVFNRFLLRKIKFLSSVLFYHVSIYSSQIYFIETNRWNIFMFVCWNLFGIFVSVSC